MKKNSFITFIITLVIVGVIIFLNYIGIKRDSTLTCTRDGNKIVFTFNENGIVKMTKDGKTVSNEEMNFYNIAMASRFAWNKMSGTYSEIVNKHISDVAAYEEDEYYSYCDYEED